MGDIPFPTGPLVTAFRISLLPQSDAPGVVGVGWAVDGGTYWIFSPITVEARCPLHNSKGNRDTVSSSLSFLTSSSIIPVLMPNYNFKLTHDVHQGKMGHYIQVFLPSCQACGTLDENKPTNIHALIKKWCQPHQNGNQDKAFGGAAVQEEGVTEMLWYRKGRSSPAAWLVKLKMTPASFILQPDYHRYELRALLNHYRTAFNTSPLQRHHSTTQH